MTVGSLFAGIGGIDLGLERTGGFETVWQVEKDNYCRRVLAKHWPDVNRYEDVKNVGSDELREVDLICGGFPCQDISVAGKGEGIEGERSGLWSEMWRIIRELRPRYALVENVSAIRFRGLGRVLGDLAEVGYDAEWESLPASAFGAPHRRDRVFVLAYDRKKRIQRMCIRSFQGEPRVPRFKDVRGFKGLRRRSECYPPRFCGSRDGVPRIVDRLKGLGNAVVPQVAQYIGGQILETEARDDVTG